MIIAVVAAALGGAAVTVAFYEGPGRIREEEEAASRPTAEDREPRTQPTGTPGRTADPEPPAAPDVDTEAAAKARDIGDAFVSVAERVSSAVVALRVQQKQQVAPGFPFGRPRSRIRRGNGSGVLIRNDGYLLTNEHVVHEATHIEVELKDGRRLEGEVVATDPATDLAVVKIDAEGLPALPFVDPGDIRVGEWVLAVGSPFGLDYTTTVGVVSAKGRAVGANEIEDYIQTDASINPGNSGGPLVSLDGKIVGINTMIMGRGTGIGFAVPSFIAENVADELISSGEIQRAWIGVTFQDLTPEIAKNLEIEGEKGALVSRVVPNGPAAEAGVKSGDVIISVDGETLKEGRDLLREVLQKDVGAALELGIIRDGERETVTVTTAERPSRQARRQQRRPKQGGGAGQGFGLGLQPLTPGIAQRLGLPPDAKGVVVAEVVPGEPADRAGLQQGDVIVSADREPVTKPRQVARALQDGSALLRVRREGSAYYIVLEK